MSSNLCGFSVRVWVWRDGVWGKLEMGFGVKGIEFFSFGYSLLFRKVGI